MGVPDETGEIWTSAFLMASLASTALQLAFANEQRRESLLHAFRHLLRSQFMDSGHVAS